MYLHCLAYDEQLASCGFSLDPRLSFRFFIMIYSNTRPGTSCLRMRQIFIVFVVGKNIYNWNLYTKNAPEWVHKRCTEGDASQGPGELPVMLQHDYSDPGKLQDDWMSSNYVSRRFSRLLDLSDSRPQLVTQVNFAWENVDSLDASELPSNARTSRSYSSPVSIGQY